jgi:hypothetical protein
MNKLTLLAVMVLISITSHAQLINCSNPEPPKQGANLCRNGTTVCTNTPNVISLTNANPFPPSGSGYTVLVRYTNGDPPPIDDCNEYTFTNCTVVSNTTLQTVTITLPSGQVLDDQVLNINPITAFKMWLNIKPDNDVQWRYFYHRTNGVCDLVLPVTLMNFTAARITEGGFTKVRLQWQTAMESNSSHFALERSNNGIFPHMVVGHVAAAGNSNSLLTYTYTDQYPSNSAINYYRIRTVDQDGTYNISEIRVVNCNGFSVQSAPQVDCSNISINGPSTICGFNADYQLSSVVTHATYTWSLSQSSLGTINSLIERATVNKYGTGMSNLQVNISRCTPATANRIKPIQLGTAGGYVPVSVSNSTDPCNGQQVHTATVQMYPGTNGSHYSWYVGGVYSGTGSSRTFYLNQGQSLTYQVHYNSGCGVFIYYGSAGMVIYPDRTARYTISPVPANTSIEVQKPAPCGGGVLPREGIVKAASQTMTAEVYDMQGNLKKKVAERKSSGKVSIPTHDLPTGNYLLRITENGVTETRQIRIEH